MLYLCFSIDQERYAIPAAGVVAVVPRVLTRRIAGAPPWVLGLMKYEDQVIPLIDLVYLLSQMPCTELLSSRCMIVQYKAPGLGERTVGLLAEGVTELRSVQESQLLDSQITLANTRFFGKVINDGKALIQTLTVNNLIPSELHEMLFGGHGEAVLPAGL